MTGKRFKTPEINVLFLFTRDTKLQTEVIELIKWKQNDSFCCYLCYYIAFMLRLSSFSCDNRALDTQTQMLVHTHTQQHVRFLFLEKVLTAFRLCFGAVSHVFFFPTLKKNKNKSLPSESTDCSGERAAGA